MKQFVFGTDTQFRELDRQLDDGMCHVFKGCALPAGCTPATARLGFEKSAGAYILYIDKNITATLVHPEFLQLLAQGQTKFLCLEDMIFFLQSLQPLFPAQASASGGGANPIPAIPEEPQEPVVDKEALRRLQEEADAPKIVYPKDIAEPLKRVVFGQDEAIDSLCKRVVFNRMRKTPKLLTIGILGPTGTGKSETGKYLAAAMTAAYGTPFGFINIKGNQMVGDHNVHSFFGAPPGYVGYGKPTLLEPVRENPNHVIVIEEIEKAAQTVLTGLMEAIDTGILEMADNSPSIDLNHCILLFTSNIPVDMSAYQIAPVFARSELCRDAFTKHCGRPEISGKIGNFLVYSKLSYDARADIITKFLRQELQGYDMTLKSVDLMLMHEFLRHETKYGARPLMALVSDALGDQLLLGGQLETLRGKRVSLSGTIDHIAFTVEEGE